MTTQECTIKEAQELLPHSEVFPKHIRNMLLENLNGLTPKALGLLFEILQEEKRRLATLT